MGWICVLTLSFFILFSFTLLLKSVCSSWPQCGHIAETIIMHPIVPEVRFCFLKFIFWSILGYFSIQSMTHYAAPNFRSENNEYIEIQERNLCFSASCFFCIFNINLDPHGKKVWESVILDSVSPCPLHPSPTPNPSLSSVGLAS